MLAKATISTHSRGNSESLSESGLIGTRGVSDLYPFIAMGAEQVFLVGPRYVRVVVAVIRRRARGGPNRHDNSVFSAQSSRTLSTRAIRMQQMLRSMERRSRVLISS